MVRASPLGSVVTLCSHDADLIRVRTKSLCNSVCNVPLHRAVVHVDVLREGGKEGRSKVQLLPFSLQC